MPWIERDKATKEIVGIYENRQEGYAEEWADHAELAPNFTFVTQEALDRGAQTRGYDGILDAVSFLNDPNASYAADARVAFAWRSAMWSYAETEMNKAKRPTLAKFVAGMPKPDWG